MVTIIRSKTFMKDPATANCRIYVGNLDLEVTEEQLIERFSNYGTIVGISLVRGFGFIQFEKEENAQDAIEKEHNQLFMSKKLNVRPVMTGEGGKANKDKSKQEQLNSQPPVLTQPQEEISQPEPPTHQGIQSGNKRGGGNNKRGGRGGGAGFNKGGNFNERPRENRFNNYEMPPRDSGGMFRGGPSNLASTNLAPRTFANRNDCEIIVVAKSLTEYAEFIEYRLKQLGLTVDLLFPNEDVPLGRVLANISSNGSLYAILITPQNEEHRSLTLNILHGLPQEHRNTPIEEAMTLIQRDFEAYTRGEKFIPGSVSIGSLSDRHPEAVQVLLNLLAENRQLTVLQYDRIIKYLQDKRELQIKHELGDAADVVDISSSNLSTNPKAAELQNRIMTILNSKPVTAGLTPSATTPKTTTTSQLTDIQKTINTVLQQKFDLKPASDTKVVRSPSPLSHDSKKQAPILNDPSVQKALDSLLQGDLIKNLVKRPATTNSDDGFDTFSSNYKNLRKF